MKRTLILLTICAVFLTGCATKIVTSQDELPTARYDPAFLAVNDVDEPQGAVRVVQEIEARQAEEEAAAAEVVDEGEWYDEYYEESYYEPSYSTSYSGDGFKQQGVREYNGRTETWYSSNQLYHYRTGEWTVDDEGYYRDSDGYYVVAASDIAEGETLETSKGTAKVYDSGCDDGVTDFYTAF